MRRVVNINEPRLAINNHHRHSRQVPRAPSSALIGAASVPSWRSAGPQLTRLSEREGRAQRRREEAKDEQGGLVEEEEVGGGGEKEEEEGRAATNLGSPTESPQRFKYDRKGVFFIFFWGGGRKEEKIILRRCRNLFCTAAAISDC